MEGCRPNRRKEWVNLVLVTLKRVRIDDSILREEDKSEREDRATGLIGRSFEGDSNNFFCHCVRIKFQRRHFVLKVRVIGGDR